MLLVVESADVVVEEAAVSVVVLDVVVDGAAAGLFAAYGSK